MVATLCAAGCGTRSARTPPPAPAVVAEDPLERAIARAERQGDPAQRAALYLQALQEAWPTRPQLAADLLVRLLPPAGLPTPAAALTKRQRFDLHAVALEMALAQEDGAEAQRLLALLAPADARQLSAAAWLRARVHDLIGADRATPRTLMEALAARAQADPRGAADVWRRLSKMSSFDLDRLHRSDSSSALRAWAAVARDMNKALTASGRAAAWRLWRVRNPHHAAARFPPPDLGAQTEPGRIAVLIPTSGDLAEFGASIRDGLLAAYLHARPEQQRLVFVDTGALSVREAYEQALAAGAEVVVGPLDKGAVSALARLAPRLPIVALNTPDAEPATMPANIVQLALAVEDEAAAVARALLENGVRRVALFRNNSAWAARATARLRRETGVRVVVATPVQGARQITEVAATALAIGESAARHAELEAMLSARLAFTPRPRDDIDAVVAFVEENELLALKPALNFHFAGDLPVYVWSRAPRGALAGRLDGVRVCDIPWRLHPSALADHAVAAFGSPRAASPLFALGVDAYRVANQLPRLTTYGESIAGSTGVLTLTDNGGIRRELAWAEAVGDHLVPLPTW